MKPSEKRDPRYAAYIILAAILVLAFFIYHQGNLPQPWTRVPEAADGPFPGFPVDINTADAEALMLLPGVGRTTARTIIAEREKRRGFKSIDDLKSVRGMGEEKFEALKKYIVAGKDRKKE